MDTKMIETLRRYFETQPVEKAWIFGSFARGEERPESDVDIMVVFNRDAKVGMRYFHIINGL